MCIRDRPYTACTDTVHDLTTHQHLVNNILMLYTLTMTEKTPVSYTHLSPLNRGFTVLRKVYFDKKKKKKKIDFYACHIGDV